jgi:hypothetical protein
MTRVKRIISLIKLSATGQKAIRWTPTCKLVTEPTRKWTNIKIVSDGGGPYLGIFKVKVLGKVSGWRWRTAKK